MPCSNAANDATTPRLPTLICAIVPSRLRMRSVPAIASAHLSPGKFQAFEAEHSATASQSSGSAALRNGTNVAPGHRQRRVNLVRDHEHAVTLSQFRDAG